ncbi:MAG: TetR/AcrR family transcriptional regulator [Halioglobus sp.]|jgi:AcrR family transcriptional regulator|uniref:TetR/AcrR family transcriptional regulator n=1 Tax=Candidatus Seongchinamella marina TaxID=2518990 RepID=A0ABT3SZW8_9GAMM|nr:TetR/AcrR family transcriptional regulator [Candidatus Seongchinamella marina]EEB77924.1 transcriptional regulator, TetR family [marine gamma proteobacterium HTCC2148]MBT3409820.1 TetR/AcrR family transcriptional regulator [Halieaceae bacterium]MDG1387284.1 TetR/AcrR family transcriptional regulator [Halioglobus sp.]MBT7719102.1 TetR/AcrR family transcriptional regulator [Halieaceae bacterium]MCX2974819.1 TetR/AcrR family transcriptional regulator [Candidatus Seongchinamella marina]
MKTRDRILHTSLQLFNEEGEEQTTTVDIANEMDISPGNLYYHFKGKDQIIAEIFHQYEVALSGTLTAPIERPLSSPGNVEENWYYLYVVLEEMYQYRFFYHNLDNILQRYPEIRRHFKRLIQLKRATLYAICQTLIQQSVIDTGEQQLLGLVDNMTLNLTFWLSYDQLLHDQRDPSVSIHQGVLQLLTMVAPYLGDDQLSFYRDCEAIYASMLEEAG